MLIKKQSKAGLAYYQAGQGDPLVLIHGVGLRAESWASQIDKLSQIYTVFAIDLPGHGESQQFSMSEPTLQDYTQQLMQFIDEVIKAPVYLAGHSMGGLVSLSFAGRYPKMCQGVAALNTVYQRSEADKKSIAQRLEALVKQKQANINIDATLKRWFADKQNSNAANLCREWLSANEFKGYADAYGVFAKEDGVSEALLATINFPVLYLTGSLDLNSNSQMSNKMAMNTTYGRSATVMNSGHLTQMTHADVVNEWLVEFFDDCQAYKKYNSIGRCDHAV